MFGEFPIRVDKQAIIKEFPFRTPFVVVVVVGKKNKVNGVEECGQKRGPAPDDVMRCDNIMRGVFIIYYYYGYS